MAKWSLSIVLLLVFLAPVALVQPIYDWEDKNGQWRFSTFPPGVTAKTLTVSTPTPESDPAIPTAQIDVPPISSDPRWLLVIPMADAGGSRRWTPLQFFESEEACYRAKAIGIRNFDSVYLPLVNSICIRAFEFITGKEADLMVFAIRFELVSLGFSSHLVYGKVFNRGQATARNVMIKYKVLTATGTVLMQGEVETRPNELPALTFGEFRTPSFGRGLEGLSVEAKAVWSKK